MSKSIRLYANTIGGDITSMSLYHSTIAAPNLIAEDISPATLSGVGVTVTVPDGVNTFWAKVTDSGSCANVTSSFSNTLFNPSKRYFTVANSGSLTNTVQINSPIAAGPTTGSVYQTVDFDNVSSMIIQASFVYPDYTAFKGWYTEETGGTLISTDNPLTVTRFTHTASDAFWGKFEGFTRTYNLSASKATVNEGDDLTITLSTTGVDGGTPVGYTITGISQSDLSSGSLTGNFIVTSQVGTIDLTIAADATSEGQETLTIDLDDFSCDPETVVINDTSTQPAATYSISATTPVDEGDTVIFTLTTANVANGTVLPFTITGIDSDDITGDLTGNFTVNGNTAQTIVTLVADNTTEGTETMTLALDNGGATQIVSINDTSILVGGVTINSGSLTISNTTITGSYTGTLAINYTVDTADVELGTPRVWTGGQVKCNAGFLHNPLFYGIDPIEIAMSNIGTVSPGTYTYTSTVTWSGYNGICVQHGQTPGTGSNLQQEAYCEIVTLGSGPETWTHVNNTIGSGSDVSPIPLTFA
jgi:hypothetical protein